MEIEGIGRPVPGAPPVLQGLGIISYDHQSGTYQMRAFNDGRFLEAEVKLLEVGQGITWGFSLGKFQTHSELRINDQGEWTDLACIAIGTQPPQTLLGLTVRRETR